MNDTISIDKYEATIHNGRIRYQAVAGKKKYPMPDAFSDMYDEKHLAIKKVTNDRPEMFGIDSDSYYIPLFTGGLSA